MRIIRILEYEGTPEWIKETLSNRGIRGSRRTDYHKGEFQGTIKEAILGDISDFIGTEQEREKYKKKEDTDG